MRYTKKIVSKEFNDIPAGWEKADIFQASDHFMVWYGKMQVHANNKEVNLLK